MMMVADPGWYDQLIFEHCPPDHVWVYERDK